MEIKITQYEDKEITERKIRIARNQNRSTGNENNNNNNWKLCRFYTERESNNKRARKYDIFGRSGKKNVIRERGEIEI